MRVHNLNPKSKARLYHSDLFFITPLLLSSLELSDAGVPLRMDDDVAGGARRHARDTHCTLVSKIESRPLFFGRDSILLTDPLKKSCVRNLLRAHARLPVVKNIRGWGVPIRVDDDVARGARHDARTRALQVLAQLFSVESQRERA